MSKKKPNNTFDENESDSDIEEINLPPSPNQHLRASLINDSQEEKEKVKTNFIGPKIINPDSIYKSKKIGNHFSLVNDESKKQMQQLKHCKTNVFQNKDKLINFTLNIEGNIYCNNRQSLNNSQKKDRTITFLTKIFQIKNKQLKRNYSYTFLYSLKGINKYSINEAKVENLNFSNIERIEKYSPLLKLNQIKSQKILLHEYMNESNNNYRTPEKLNVRISEQKSIQNSRSLKVFERLYEEK